MPNAVVGLVATNFAIGIAAGTLMLKAASTKTVVGILIALIVLVGGIFLTRYSQDFWERQEVIAKC